MHYVYFLKSQKNNKIYAGSTSKNPGIRTSEHNKGWNSWTKSNGPFTLLYYESYFCKKDAVLREKFYKSGFGKKIKYIIAKTVSAKG